MTTLRYADRAKKLKKPPMPQFLIKEADALRRKRKFDGLHIPPTPANWRRPPLSIGSSSKMNNTIETPTPSKRLKVLAESRIENTGHSITFTTPNETPSAIVKTARKKNMLASAVKRNMDSLLKDIEEENGESNNENTLDDCSSPGFGSEISSISPYEIDSNLRKEIATSIKTPSFLHKTLNTTNMNNATLIDISNLSPMIRKITDQVGKEFQQRFR